MIWYDMEYWYDMIWYDLIWYDLIWYDMEYFNVEHWFNLFGLKMLGHLLISKDITVKDRCNFWYQI